MTVRRSTYAQQAYDVIREAIAENRLAPGTKVVVRPLAEELGLSPTPIKGALAALERDGFLTAVPHRGYFVPVVSVSDMREIYELREVIDGIAARRSAAAAGRSDLARRLNDLLERQQSCLSEGDLGGYSELDLAFHQAILEASGNSRLLRVASNLLGQLRLGRVSSARIPGQPRRSLHEHATILAAIEAGKEEVAERAARRHVRGAGAALDLSLSSSRGEPVIRGRNGIAGRPAQAPAGPAPRRSSSAANRE